MMVSKPLVWVCIGLVLGVLLGVVGSQVLGPEPRPQTALTCRPTLPAQALADTSEPTLLLWGNSLLFDHDWTETGHLPVNCARQGQTAAAALPLTAALPPVAPDMVLLAFGSVETFLATRDGHAVDHAAFARDMQAIVAEITTRWPEARVIAAGLPGFQDSAPALSRAVAASGAEFLDLERVLAGLGTEASYDGIHLTRRAYEAWEQALRP